MRNPYMKFRNSSIHGFKVMLCIKKRDEWTEGWTDGRTNNPEAICPSNFFEVGGIKTKQNKTKKKNNNNNKKTTKKKQLELESWY